MFASFMAPPTLFLPTPVGGLGIADTALDPSPGDPGGVGPRPAAGELRQQLLGSDDNWLRERFLRVEARYGRTAAVQLLLALYSEPRYTDLRNLAMQLLDQLRAAGGSGDGRAVDSLKQTLRGIYKRREEIENELLARILGTKPAKLDRTMGHRDVDGSGGWGYTQFANGTILVRVDPRPGAPLQGKALGGSAKAAVLREIGAFPGTDRVPTSAIAPSAAQTALARDRAATATAADAATSDDAEDRADAKHPGRRTVSALLSAAGVAAAAGMPVLAVGAATAAGMIKLVVWARKRKAKKRAIEAEAKRLDTPFAEDYPRLFAKALTWSPAEREAFVAKAKGRAGRRRILRLKDRLLHQAALVQVLDLTLKAEARKQLSAVGDEDPAAVAVAGFSGYAGLADLDAGAGTDGLGLDTVTPGDLAPAQLAPRLVAAEAGDYIEGGVRLPREACAFVAGYLRRRYIPATKRVMTPELRGKLEAMAAQFAAASQAGSEEAAARQALAIGISNAAINTITRAFSEINARLVASIAADGLRAWAGQVLRHAAACLTVLGAPLASTRVFLAITGDIRQAAAVEAAVASATAAGAVTTTTGLLKATMSGTPTPNTPVSAQSAVVAAEGVVAAQAIRAEDAAQQVAAVAAPIPALREAAAQLTGAKTPAEAQAAATTLRREAAQVAQRGPAEASAASAVISAVDTATDEAKKLAKASAAAAKTRAGALKLKVPLAPSQVPGLCNLTPQGSISRFVCEHPWLAALGGLLTVGGLLLWQKDRVVTAASAVAGRVRGAAAALPGPVGVAARALGGADGADGAELEGLDDYATAPRGARLPKPPRIEYHEGSEEDDDDSVADLDGYAGPAVRTDAEAEALLDGIGFS